MSNWFCSKFHRLKFDKITDSLQVGTFFETQCRVIALSCGIKISKVHCLVLSQSTRVTDGPTDRQKYRQYRGVLHASCGN